MRDRPPTWPKVVAARRPGRDRSSVLDSNRFPALARSRNRAIRNARSTTGDRPVGVWRSRTGQGCELVMGRETGRTPIDDRQSGRRVSVRRQSTRNVPMHETNVYHHGPEQLEAPTGSSRFAESPDRVKVEARQFAAVRPPQLLRCNKGSCVRWPTGRSRRWRTSSTANDATRRPALRSIGAPER